jgi:hypothetical protein
MFHLSDEPVMVEKNQGDDEEYQLHVFHLSVWYGPVPASSL